MLGPHASRFTLKIVAIGSCVNQPVSEVPVTPFHFGPGLLGKGLAARWYSWTAFAASNVFIDCESLYYLWRGAWPVHRQLHTFLGAGLVGVATALLLIGIRALWPRLRTALAAKSPSVRAEATPLGIVVGGMLGALTHPLLDGIMHSDIQPFQPWTASNPLHGVIGVAALHEGCLAAGLVGAILLFVGMRGSFEQRGK